MITEESLLRGTSDFKELRTKNYIYVDKTHYIVNMFNTDKKCFIARPRRFGKTLMLSAINYLYLGNHNLFEGLEIYKYVDAPIFQPHPVIYLDMSNITISEYPADFTLDQVLVGILPIKTSLLGTLRMIATTYNVEITCDSPSDAFGELIFKISAKLDTVVILIDEYDHLLTDTFDRPIYQKAIHNFLRNFYRNIKTHEKHIHITYITGISKFSKIGVFSFLNDVTDFSNDIAYSDMFGYTNEELCRYFKSYIDETADKMQLPPEALIDKLKSYYDGYSFSGERTVYNPVSIRYFFAKKEFDDYWIETGSQKSVEQYIHYKNVTVEEFEYVKIDPKQLKQPGEITQELEPALFLYQAGYLTQRQIIDKNGHVEYYLTYPNNEVRAAMIRLTRHNFYSSFNTKDGEMVELERCLKIEDYVNMLHVLNTTFSKIVYDDYSTLEKKKDEMPLECFYRNSIFFLMYFAQLDVDAEPHGDIGRPDILLRNNKKEILFELKISKSGTEANVKIKFCEAIGQMNKYVGSHENPIPICLAINGKIRRIVLASINDDVFKWTPPSGKTPATFTRIGAIEDFVKSEDAKNNQKPAAKNQSKSMMSRSKAKPQHTGI